MNERKTVKQCATCPWKVGAILSKIPNYQPDLHCRLASTINSGLESLRGNLHIMACRDDRPAPRSRDRRTSVRDLRGDPDRRTGRVTMYANRDHPFASWLRREIDAAEANLKDRKEARGRVSERISTAREEGRLNDATRARERWEELDKTEIPRAEERLSTIRRCLQHFTGELWS